MWALDNLTPFEAERTWVRDKEGVHHWIVVVKATYDVQIDGSLGLAANQLKALHAPKYSGADGASSLRYDADLVAIKPATDVYLNAIAYSPNGRPSTRVKVGMQVGGLRKELTVVGHRTWSRTLAGVAPSLPEPFESMPITYERAFGGYDHEDEDPRHHRLDFRNPVGTGVAANDARLVGKPAPNVEDPWQKMGKGWPPGFGAIASYWSPRKELAGTYDDDWMTNRRPLLPVDYDPSCLLCSPPDQQVAGYLTGGETVELINLTPNGHLRFTLPTVALSFQSFFSWTRKDHAATLVSVIIESEGPRLIVVWQTSLRCGNDAEYLDRTVIRRHGEL
ncbi:MAG: DUF2169 domain-containing protein [Acidobacteriota bacterium]